MKQIIIKCQGKWCVRCYYPLFTEPKISICHWPIGHASHRVDLSRYNEQEVFASRSGLFRLRTAPYEYVNLYLIDGGKTQSIETITENISCPKVRRGIETCWKNGRWEKLLKSGWKPA